MYVDYKDVGRLRELAVGYHHLDPDQRHTLARAVADATEMGLVSQADLEAWAATQDKAIEQ